MAEKLGIAFDRFMIMENCVIGRGGYFSSFDEYGIVLTRDIVRLRGRRWWLPILRAVIIFASTCFLIFVDGFFEISKELRVIVAAVFVVCVIALAFIVGVITLAFTVCHCGILMDRLLSF